MLTKVSPLTWNLRSGLPESVIGVAAMPPRAPVKVWKFWARRLKGELYWVGAATLTATRVARIAEVFILEKWLDSGIIGYNKRKIMGIVKNEV